MELINYCTNYYRDIMSIIYSIIKTIKLQSMIIGFLRRIEETSDNQSLQIKQLYLEINKIKEKQNAFI